MSLTKDDIATKTHREMGIPKPHAKLAVDVFFSTLIQCLKDGHDIKIPELGKFLLSDKRERIGRNPRTGEPMVIEPRRVVKFHLSQHLISNIAEVPNAD